MMSLTSGGNSRRPNSAFALHKTEQDDLRHCSGVSAAILQIIVVLPSPEIGNCQVRKAENGVPECERHAII